MIEGLKLDETDSDSLELEREEPLGVALRDLEYVDRGDGDSLALPDTVRFAEEVIEFVTDTEGLREDDGVREPLRDTDIVRDGERV